MIRCDIKIKLSAILEECIHNGVDIGVHRAHKHNDKPGQDHIRDSIQRAIIEQLSNYITFDDDDAP